MSEPRTGVPAPAAAAAGATVAAAVASILESSAFLRRALLSEGFDPASPASRAEALAWMTALACEPWDAPRVQAAARSAIERSGSAPPGAEAVGRALRQLRRRLLCALLLRDAAGLAPLEEVTGAMTALAECAVQELLRVLAPELAQRFGTPVDAAGVPQDLLVLAMGKAGAQELNVSSDLDLIFVYGDAVACRRAAGSAGAAPPIEPQEFFDRLGRRLVAALDEPDAQGFVFRVDMRLRPHGDAGPLTVGLEMLEEYLLREGREWERFAWAKARVVSSAVLAGEREFAVQRAALEALVLPFVYRKYFDFGAIGAIRDLHRRIGAEARRSERPWRAGAAAAPGRDIKLGRGGIREIEFLAQTYCIMRGGREHRLRARGTVPTLRTLVELGLMAPAEGERLVGDYRFLRRLEHALQYRDDAQTHALPADPAGRLAVARLLGLDSADALMARFTQVSEDVARSFDSLFPPEAAGRDGSAQGNGGDARTAAPEAPLLQAEGFADAAESAERLRRLFASPRIASMSPAAQATVARLAEQAVRLIGAIARAAPSGGTGADELLLRWVRLVEVIGRRQTYLALLSEFPRAHERVLRLLAAGGWPTEYLLRHPILLDELVDPRTQRFANEHMRDDLEAVPGAAEPYWQPWTAELAAQLRAADGDMERQMNLLRDAHHAQTFRLLLADLAGELDLEHLADHLSALADAVLQIALEAAWRSLEAARADPGLAAPRFAIVAYGKLGGRELGYASDLDLTFVFDEGGDAADPQAAERATQLSTQLARRLLHWLTTVTSSGALFEIDLRLRPNGDAGPLVTPFPAFERYMSNADGHGAWVWEHQALTRARACAGDRELGARVEAVRARVLRQPRDPQGLAQEVVAMRRRMLEGHVNRSALFDLKHDRGGMVDIEFTVQFLVLAHAQRHAELLANRGNIGLLGIAAGLGLIDADLARDCAAAYRHYRRLQHALRLNGVAQARVADGRVAPQIEAVARLWRSVLGTDEPQPAPRKATGAAPR
jgi:glutamate-ammonia-ligase adenylyltransferase